MLEKKRCGAGQLDLFLFRKNANWIFCEGSLGNNKEDESQRRFIDKQDFDFGTKQAEYKYLN